MCNNCVHLSLANAPFVRVPESCCAVLTYFIPIARSGLILSNGQTKPNLCVLATCLIVGLLPFIGHLHDGFITQKKNHAELSCVF